MSDQADKNGSLLRFLLSVVAVAAAYYLGALLGLSLSFKPDYIAALWPPNAILLAALLLSKPKQWAAYLCAIVPAELAADLPSGIPLTMVIGFVGSDWIEVLSAAFLLRKFSGIPPSFETLRKVFAYCICCVLIAPFISSFPGAMITGLGESDTSYFIRWARWFMSDALTHLMVTPVLILMATFRWKSFFQSKRFSLVEFVLLYVLLLAVMALAFGGVMAEVMKSPGILFFPFPFVLWAAVRFESRGVFLASLILTSFSIYTTSRGIGPFTLNSIPMNVINLQIFLIISLVPLIFMAVSITELKTKGTQLKEREHQYRALFEKNKTVMLLIEPSTGEIIEANPSACKFYGYSKDQLKTMQINQINTLSHDEIKKEMEIAAREMRNSFQFKHRLASGEIRDVEVHSGPIVSKGRTLLCSIVHDVTERRLAEEDRIRLITALQKALSEVKTLRGMIPICAGCKKIRDDKGYWNRIESYIEQHSDASFSHGLCPECAEAYYGDQQWFVDLKKKRQDEK